MTKPLSDNQRSKITSRGFKLLEEKGVQFVYRKTPYMKGIFLIYPKGTDTESNDFVYSTYQILDLNGFCDGYFKGLNKVLEE